MAFKKQVLPKLDKPGPAATIFFQVNSNFEESYKMVDLLAKVLEAL